MGVVLVSCVIVYNYLGGHLAPFILDTGDIMQTNHPGFMTMALRGSIQ